MISKEQNFINIRMLFTSDTLLIIHITPEIKLQNRADLTSINMFQPSIPFSTPIIKIEISLIMAMAVIKRCKALESPSMTWGIYSLLSGKTIKLRECIFCSNPISSRSSTKLWRALAFASTDALDKAFWKETTICITFQVLLLKADF